MAFIDIVAEDGHRMGCWFAPSQQPRRGSVVVLQEIFGVNSHIQAVCNRLAEQGYDAYAPALFDRMQQGFTSGYSKEEVAEALKFLPRLDWDTMASDTLATVSRARELSGKVAVLGFCLGASVAYIAAQRDAGISAVVGYYGGHIVNCLKIAPLAPMLLHYGETDHTIPMSDVERIRNGRPECEVHVYPAGHGFNCDERTSFEPRSAEIAWARSLQWLQTYLA
ncbi:dienelactone hydrolase family protein [Acidovorax sp.]|uniref:dienelactone hydrolase family protein n=1 Tax=Acidovorax sp. TaxID=1872122 RepID=UPI0040384783